MSSILVLNAGSSSIKYKIYQEASLSILCEGSITDLGGSQCCISHKQNGEKVTNPLSIKTVNEAMLVIQEYIEDSEKITLIGHRVVHGGSQFSTPVVIDSAIEKAIDALSYLAPLHNPANLVVIQIARTIFPKATHIAVFDTAFYQTLPEKAFRYAIPDDLYKKDMIRVYGFHGTSHAYVSQKAQQYLSDKQKPSSKLITLHLGNGCSMAAIKEGRCVDTSMGLSPLQGLMMGTRSGDVDPSIFSFLSRVKGMSVSEIDMMLNKKSGLMGISGDSDMRALESRAEKGDNMASLALEMFVYRIQRYIGSYFAVLNGLDALIFTAGIGENSDYLRQKIVSGLSSLGLDIDITSNESGCEKEVNDLSSDKSNAKTLVIPTNEELFIAKQAVSLLEGNKGSSKN